MGNLKLLVGQNVRKCRLANGLTQEQLAARAEMTNDYISRLELGKENPSLETLERISKALKVDSFVLFAKG